MSCQWCEGGACLRCELARVKTELETLRANVVALDLDPEVKATAQLADARQQLHRLREEIDRNKTVFEAMAAELSAARPVLALAESWLESWLDAEARPEPDTLPTEAALYDAVVAWRGAAWRGAPSAAPEEPAP